MMLRESKEMGSSCNTPNMKTVRKWKTEPETDDILSSLTYRNMVGAMQNHRKGICFGANPFSPLKV